MDHLLLVVLILYALIRIADHSLTESFQVVQICPDRCHLHLYRCPQYRPYHDLILGRRWKEIIGVQHTKLYAFDDVVIITGANLSHSYFTNRCDRYYKIHDESLARFSHALIATIGQASFRYDSRSRSLMSPTTPLQLDRYLALQESNSEVSCL